MLFFSAGMARAQDLNISGRVVDAAGDAVVGASVVVKGTTTGVTTGINGDYDISAPSDGTLTFSFLGMGALDVAVNGRARIDVTLEGSDTELEEVMVVAYGTAKRSTFTGSAAVVKSEAIERRQAVNITSTLTGAVAGVQGLSADGAPGSKQTIRIRGVGSIYAGNSPLYVVDGVPYDGDINAINNADIETLTVLKDASSNALYGARGANGVVMITTKKGKSGNATVTLDAKWGANRRMLPFYNVMTDPGMYYETMYQSIYNSLSGSSKTFQNAYNTMLSTLGYQVYSVPEGELMLGTNGKLNPNATLGYLNRDPEKGDYYFMPDDWYNELFNRNNLRQEYNATVSGGGDKFNYYASVGYLDDNGLITNSGYNRFSARGRGDYQAKKWLKLGANFSYAQSKESHGGSEEGSGTSSGNIFYVANYVAPIYPLYIRDAQGNIMKDNRGKTMYDYADGRTVGASHKRGWMPGAQPASQIELDQTYYLMDIFNGSWYADADIYGGLKASANWGVHADNTHYHSLANPFYGQYSEMGGYVYMENQRTTSFDQNYLLKFVRDFGLHNVDLLAGMDSYHRTYGVMSGQKEKIFDPDSPELGNAISNPTVTSHSLDYATLGFLSRAQYNYAQKYYLSLSYRRDASSVFAPENRWGNFWSAGLAYNLKNENFMSQFKFIDLLKVKASYGEQGNDYLYYNGTSTRNYFAYQDQYNIVKNGDDFATTLYYKGNRDISWEKSNTLNAGVDFGFFANKLTGSVEYFNRRTSDMLYNMPTPSSLGYSSYPLNVGAMSNYGVELDLKGVVFQNEKITASLTGNLTLIKNRIQELSPALAVEGQSERQFISGIRMYKEGESMYNLYLRQWAGVRSEDGKQGWYIEDATIEKQRERIRTDNADNAAAMQTALNAFNGTLYQANGRQATTSWSYADQYETGNVMPVAYGGFGAQVEGYGFDLSLQFSYQMGGRIFDYGYQALMQSGTDKGKNWHKDILQAWTPANPNTNVPLLDASDTYYNAASDRWLISSKFLCLQNITLGYTLPKEWTQKMQIASIRIYGVVDNVALWAARTGLDPRQTYYDTDGNNYSPMRTISGGIKLTF
jgi:TonB-linked SusC/RagA family outer membrane protein